MDPLEKRPTSDSELKKRLATAALGIPAVLGLAYAGGFYWTAFVVLLGLLGTYEFLAMGKKKGHRPSFGLAYLILLLFMGAFGGVGDFVPGYFQAGVLGLVALSGALLVWGFPGFSVIDLALTWVGPLYLSVFLSYGILPIHELDRPFFALLMVFSITWASDTGAYFAGRLAGQRKLAPKLSPKKTWEGSIGGLCFSMLAAVGIGWNVLSLGQSLFLGFSGSVCAQLGDLAVSAMKRYFGVKDSGRILPGHGGILDRFDSFMWVLPVVYYFLRG